MKKSSEAFRTISEVADWLGTPAHVLRFWESRFTQIRPVKRAGGRRYYRPSDMRLLGGIKKLLHDDGITIRGVQKILREQGIKHVAALAPDVAPGSDAPSSPGSPARAEAASHTASPTPAEILPAQSQPQPADSIAAEPGAPVPDEVPPFPAPVAAPVTTPRDPDDDDSSDLPPVPPFIRSLRPSGEAMEALDPQGRNEVASLYARLKALRDRMSGGPSGE